MSPYQNAGVTYRAQAVETAGPAQLLIMLYDGAIAAIARAEHAIDSGEKGSIEVVNQELTRAQDIITELMLSLDHERGGPIAGNLSGIYQFCLEMLTDANMEKSDRNLPGVKQHLMYLRDAFATAAAALAGGDAA